MELDEKFMQRCLDLARQGLGSVSPNPLVGAVLAIGDRIIGEGFHQKFGGPHAEVNAISQVADQRLLKQATLYVNLEPCCHHGKTPPCADLIIDSGVKRLVIAHTDPNPLVVGQGLIKLRQAGVEVISGVLSEEALQMNRRFVTFFQKKRPYIILKWAQTRDGFIDIDRSKPGSNRSNWITNDSMKQLVHQWRSMEDAVMVGTRTAYNDDPALTVREWAGRNPLRIVIDENLSLPGHLKLFDRSAPTLILTSVEKEDDPPIHYLKLDFTAAIIPQLLDTLYSRGIQSLIVEGGLELLDSFFALGLWDEARVLEGDKLFVKGKKAPAFHGKLLFEERFENDNYRCFGNQI
ncbi:MAG: bifunctional diaminohydroxyphosphoribosylaminopyrimidine deaminase/5-amino-6-(5-phosphoribosylamino)uracil reductase RibD [Bacteroidota bacterium]